MIRQALHDDWSVRAVSNLPQIPANIRDLAIPARVPGCIHTDLLRAGLIDDPYFGTNEPKLLWIGLTDWQYVTYFDADPRLFDHERIDLVCDGLDTVATIWLNGTEVARTQNMHRGYRFDVRPMLKKGRNELVIRFDSPVNYATAMRDKLGHLPAIGFGSGPFNFIRKMACNFGWDWGPVVATCGIWRGVRVEGWSGRRLGIERFGTFTRISKHGNSMQGTIHFDLRLDGMGKPTGKWPYLVEVQLQHPNGSVTDFSFDYQFDRPMDEKAFGYMPSLEKPLLWWPAGRGAATTLWATRRTANERW